MKQKLFIIMIIIFILCIITGVIYFILKTYSKNNDIAPEEISYETINMVTSLKLGVSEFDSIHPYITQNRDVIYLNTLIYEPLLSITEDYNITNCLAKEWSKTGETNYVIKLKENIKWSNGDELIAQNVKLSIETLQNNKKSVYYENVKDIINVNIVDNYTFTLELSKEIPFFEYYLIFPIVLEKPNTENPIGTGQYKVAKIDKTQVELTKNGNWRNIETENSNIKTITIYLYETMGEIYNDFKMGRIDLLHTTNRNVEEYIGTMGYEQKRYLGREYEYLSLNCEDSILQYKEVRQAIKQALNQEKIVAYCLENKVQVSYFSIGQENYLLKDVEIFHKQNLEKAQKILEDAGWIYEYGIWQKVIDGRTKTLNIKLSVSKDNEERLKVAEEIKAQLETLGIKITIEQVTESQYESYIKNHDYEILLTGIYTPLSPDLTNFFGKENLANYQNQEIISIIEDLNNITNEEMLKEEYKKIIEIYQDEVPYIGLYRNQNLVAYNINFRGNITPNNYSIYYNFSEWYHVQ